MYFIWLFELFSVGLLLNLCKFSDPFPVTQVLCVLTIQHNSHWYFSRVLTTIEKKTHPVKPKRTYTKFYEITTVDIYIRMSSLVKHSLQNTSLFNNLTVAII